MFMKRKISSAIAAIMLTSSITISSFADNAKYDVNNDGYINAKDALVILKLVVQGIDVPVYDINDDGYVNAKDALFILKYSVGMTAVSNNKPSTSSGSSPGTTSDNNSGTTSSSTSGTMSESTSGTNSGTTSGNESGSMPTAHPSAMDSIITDYTRKWAYNVIPDRLKKAYEALYDGVSNGTKIIDVSLLGVNVSDIAQIFWACDFDNPQFVNISDGCSYNYLGSRVQSIVMTYGRTIAQTKTVLAQVAKCSADIIAKAQSRPTVYDRVKVFHDWLIENTEYVTDGAAYISETDGPIVNGKASSAGYAKAFEYLCHSAGIECVCVKGKIDGKTHVWNIVYIDGSWYHIDVAKDDATGTQKYFLVSQEQICADRTLSNSFDIPVSPNAYGV